MDLEDDDILGDIKAAQTEIATGEKPEPVVETKAEETSEQKAERERDELGRFKAKEEAEAAALKGQPAEAKPKLETAQPAAEPATDKDKPAIVPPATWSAEAKAAFLQAPEAIQKEILKREADMDKGRQEWSGKAEAFNRLDKVLAPHRERLALNGVSEDQFIGSLLAAENVLRTRPYEGIAYLAQQYGVDLRRYAQTNGQPQQGQQPGPARDPAVAQLMQQVQTLTQTLSSREQAEQQAHQQSVLSEIERFAKDPQNLYFENVRPMIAAILRSNEASDKDLSVPDRLKKAYEQACWADPTVRGLVQTAATKKAEADKKAKEAKQMSGSVTGAPGPGKTVPQRSSNANDDYDEDIRAAYRQLAAS